MKKRYEDTCRRLRQELPERQAALQTAITHQLQGFAIEVADAAAQTFLAGCEAILLDWHRNGGKLSDVEAKIDDYGRTCEPGIRQTIERRQQGLTIDVQRVFRDHVKAWVHHHLPGRRLESVALETSQGGNFELPGHRGGLA